MLKVLELFGGIGACTQAMKRLGIDFEKQLPLHNRSLTTSMNKALESGCYKWRTKDIENQRLRLKISELEKR